MVMENAYKTKLAARIEDRWPSAIVLRNDAGFRQGITDLLILHGPHWAALEVKKDRIARRQPNQLYYVNLLNDMSFGAFIYPDNERKVLDAIQQSWGLGE